ncbi:hypothetical protein [Limnobacter sp.]|uniref:hypothetical protein n=1 Tax=Limnobacter sp. TaxID=2003368 RepID=UPI00311F232D
MDFFDIFKFSALLGVFSFFLNYIHGLSNILKEHNLRNETISAKKEARFTGLAIFLLSFIGTYISKISW